MKINFIVIVAMLMAGSVLATHAPSAEQAVKTPANQNREGLVMRAIVSRIRTGSSVDRMALPERRRTKLDQLALTMARSTHRHLPYRPSCLFGIGVSSDISVILAE